MKLFQCKNSKQLILFSLAVSMVSVILGSGIHMVRAAWEAPPANPPAGDIFAPLNAADTKQFKKGWLRIGSEGAPDYTLDVQGNAYVWLDARIIQNLNVGQKATVTGDIETGGDILPAVSGSKNLGSTEKTWQSLYLTPATGQGKIFFGKNNYLVYKDLNYKFFGNVNNNPVELLSISQQGAIAMPGGISAVGGNFTVDGLDGSVDITGGHLGIGSYNNWAQTESYGGDDKYGIYGETKSNVLAGVMGSAITGIGVFGDSDTSYGVYGESTSSSGVYGLAENPSMTLGSSSGVYGKGANKIGGMILGNKYYSFGVYGEGGKIDNFSGELYSSGVYGKGGAIASPGVNQTQKTYGVYGYAGNISSVNPGTFRTYGVYGQAADSVSGPATVSYGVYGSAGNGLGTRYAGYFEGDVVIDGTLTGGSSALDIQGDLVLDVGQDLKLSDGAAEYDNVHLVYTENEDGNCLRIKFNDGPTEKIIAQFGDPDDTNSCKPLCETGWCVHDDPLNDDCSKYNRHESQDYFCSGTQKVCCRPGVYAPPYER